MGGSWREQNNGNKGDIEKQREKREMGRNKWNGKGEVREGEKKGAGGRKIMGIREILGNRRREGKKLGSNRGTGNGEGR